MLRIVEKNVLKVGLKVVSLASSTLHFLLCCSQKFSTSAPSVGDARAALLVSRVGSCPFGYKTKLPSHSEITQY